MQETKAKETAAVIVLLELERTMERAQKIAAVVSEKTTTITRVEPPSPAPGKNIAAPQEHPPFFERIKQLTVSINNSLSDIEDIMRRCEL